MAGPAQKSQFCPTTSHASFAAHPFIQNQGLASRNWRKTRLRKIRIVFPALPVYSKVSFAFLGRDNKILIKIRPCQNTSRLQAPPPPLPPLSFLPRPGPEYEVTSHTSFQTRRSSELHPVFCSVCCASPYPTIYIPSLRILEQHSSCR
jgi:hypothetical protein